MFQIFSQEHHIGNIIAKSTTLAANKLYNILTIIILRPPLLQKEGKLFLLHIYNPTLKVDVYSQGSEPEK